MPLPPRKCPECGGDLQYVKTNRKHHCPRCSTEAVYVIWTTDYLDGYEAAERKYDEKIRSSGSDLDAVRRVSGDGV